MARYALPPADVYFWLHIGANVASNRVDLSRGVRQVETIHDNRGILAPQDLVPATARAFAGQPGYKLPVDVLSDQAVGALTRSLPRCSRSSAPASNASANCPGIGSLRSTEASIAATIWSS